jgi:hypothetical protein
VGNPRAPALVDERDVEFRRGLALPPLALRTWRELPRALPLGALAHAARAWLSFQGIELAALSRRPARDPFVEGCHRGLLPRWSDDVCEVAAELVTCDDRSLSSTVHVEIVPKIRRAIALYLWGNQDGFFWYGRDRESSRLDREFSGWLASLPPR